MRDDYRKFFIEPIFISIILFSSVIFAQEKTSGFLYILRTTPNGRTKTGIYKILTAIIVTIGIVLAFTLSTWAVFGIRLGFSSPYNAIQILGNFTFCPFLLNIGQYFALTILIKLLSFTVFTLVIIFISVLMCNYSIIYILGTAFFGLNFLLYTLKSIDAENIFKNLNFMAVSTVNPLFIRYRSINFFGNVCSYIPVMLMIFGAFLFILSLGIVLTYHYGYEGISSKEFTYIALFEEKIKKIFSESEDDIEDNENNAKISARKYSKSLFAYEIYKMLISSKYIAIVGLLIILKIFVSAVEYEPINSYPDFLYHEYTTVLEGKLSDEKCKYIANERARIDTAFAQQETMQVSYIKGELSDTEYKEYLKEYDYAYSRNDVFKVIEDHKNYIDDVKRQKNVNASFLYDTGWRRLFDGKFDSIQYTLILLLISGVFTNEYSSKSSSGGFVQILRTTKRGRNTTFAAKYTASILISSAAAVFFNAIDFLLILKNYGFPSLQFPLVSIKSFAQTDTDVTILQYLILFFTIRLVGTMLFSVIVCGLSEILRKNISVMSTAIILTLLPMLLLRLGLSPMKYIDFTGILTATSLYLISSQMNLFGNDIVFLIVFLLAAIIVSSVISIRAYFTYST